MEKAKKIKRQKVRRRIPWLDCFGPDARQKGIPHPADTKRGLAVKGKIKASCLCLRKLTQTRKQVGASAGVFSKDSWPHSQVGHVGRAVLGLLENLFFKEVL